MLLFLLEVNPLITFIIIVLVVIALLWSLDKLPVFEVAYLHKNWSKVDAVDSILDVSDRMAQDLQEYADSLDESDSNDPARATFDLLDEYDATKKKLEAV